MTRSERILKVLAKSKQATIAEIMKATRAPKDHQKFYAATAIAMIKRGAVKRRKVDGIWTYRA